MAVLRAISSESFDLADYLAANLTDKHVGGVHHLGCENRQPCLYYGHE